MAYIGNAPVFPTQSVLPGNLQVTGNATISGTTNSVGNLTENSNNVVLEDQPKVPMFSAKMSNSNVQQLTNATFTKIIFDTKEFDTDTWYSTSTGKFTPQTAGYYYFDAAVAPYNSYCANAIAIYKNDVGSKIGDWRLSDVTGQPQVHAIIHANGSTDNFCVYCRFETGNNYVHGSDSSGGIYQGFTYFQARLLRAD